MNDIRIEDHLKLVHMVAQRYRHIQEYDDIVGAGNIGLVKAARNYDPSRGTAFSTYAVSFITGEIRLYIRDCTQKIKIARPVGDYARRIKKLELNDCSAADIAERFGIGIVQAGRSLEAANVTVNSMDRYIDGHNRESFVNLIPIEDDRTAVFVSDFISRLTQRDQIMVTMRFQGKGQGQIGQTVGISQMMVSRHLKRIGKSFIAYLAGLEGVRNA